MSKLICMGDCIIDFLPSAPKELTYTAKWAALPPTFVPPLQNSVRTLAISGNSQTIISENSFSAN